MAEERVQRRLAAILAADVVGYSRRIGRQVPVCGRATMGWVGRRGRSKASRPLGLRNLLAAGWLALITVGCASGPEPPSGPSAITEAQRAGLGVVAIVVREDPPETEFKAEFVGSAGEGAATGAVAGTIVCLPYLIIYPLCVLAVSAAGATAIIPEDTVELITKRNAEVAKTVPVQQLFEAAIIEEARGRSGREFVHLAGPAITAGAANPQSASKIAADTVLEVGIHRLAFVHWGRGGEDPEIVLTAWASFRLAHASTDETVYAEDELMYASTRRSFSAWGAPEGKLILEEIERASRELAEVIVDRVFLEVRWQ